MRYIIQTDEVTENGYATVAATDTKKVALREFRRVAATAAGRFAVFLLDLQECAELACVPRKAL